MALKFLSSGDIDGEFKIEVAGPKLQLKPTTQNNASVIELGVLNAGTNAYAKIDAINLQNYDTNLRFWTNAAGSTTQVERMRIATNLITFPTITELRGDIGSAKFAVGNMGDASSQMMVSSRGFLTLNVSNTGSGLDAIERLRITATGAISVGSTGTNYGSSGQVLTSGGNSNPTWTTPTTGTVTGSGTLNTVARWTATGSDIGDGPITFSGATSAANSTFGGNVRISKTDATLEINNSTGSLLNADLYISVEDTGQADVRQYGAYPLAFWTNNTERMRIDSSGNVGIGVTPESWGTGGDTRAIQISTMTSLSEAFDGTQLASNFYFDGTNDKYIQSDFATSYLQIDGSHRWRYAASGTADANITWSEAMRIDSSGNIMMGKTSQSGNAALTVKSTAGGNTGIILVEGDTTNDGWGVYAVTANEYRITRFTNGSYSDKFIIDSSGNVGINASASLRFNGAGDNTHAVGYDSTIDGSFLRGQNGMRFLTGTGGGSERMRIDSSGFGYIYNRFYLASASNQGNLFFGTADAQYNIFGGGTYGYMGYNTGGYHRFLTSGTERMRIDSSGNVSVDSGRIRIAGGGSDSGTQLNLWSDTNGYCFIAGFQTIFNQGGNNSRSEVMRITSTGLGIGRTAPDYKLVVSNSNNEGIEFGPGYTSGANLFQSYNRTNSQYVRADWVASTHQWYQGDTASVEVRMSLTGSGVLTVKNDIVAYGSPSDIRLKENIKPIESALDKVSKLQGVTFDWKKSDSILDIKEDIGFIAQDVQKVVPELVRESEGGMLSMRHQGIAPILLEAIKEQQKQIDRLEEQIKKMCS